MTERSQAQNVKEHLLYFGCITPLEALNLYGCFRLAARIKELRDGGMEIETERAERNGKTFARYRYSPTCAKSQTEQNSLAK